MAGNSSSLKMKSNSIATMSMVTDSIGAHHLLRGSESRTTPDLVLQQAGAWRPVLMLDSLSVREGRRG